MGAFDGGPPYVFEQSFIGTEPEFINGLGFATAARGNWVIRLRAERRWYRALYMYERQSDGSFLSSTYTPSSVTSFGNRMAFMGDELLVTAMEVNTAPSCRSSTSTTAS